MEHEKIAILTGKVGNRKEAWPSNSFLTYAFIVGSNEEYAIRPKNTTPKIHEKNSIKQAKLCEAFFKRYSDLIIALIEIV